MYYCGKYVKHCNEVILIPYTPRTEKKCFFIQNIPLPEMKYIDLYAMGIVPSSTIGC